MRTVVTILCLTILSGCASASRGQPQSASWDNFRYSDAYSQADYRVLTNISPGMK